MITFQIDAAAAESANMLLGVIDSSAAPLILPRAASSPGVIWGAWPARHGWDERCGEKSLSR